MNASARLSLRAEVSAAVERGRSFNGQSMGTRRKYQPDAIDNSALELQIAHLGLESIAEYRSWCARHGFRYSRRRTPQKDQCERDYAKRLAGQQRLVLRKRQRRQTIELFVAAATRRKCGSDDWPPLLKILSRRFDQTCEIECRPAVDTKPLRRLMHQLVRCRAKLAQIDHLCRGGDHYHWLSLGQAVARVAAHAKSWIRPPEIWHPRSHNPWRQFASLVRHLFVRYGPMPHFFDHAWFAGRRLEGDRQRRWYIAVGSGRSIRHCDLPLPLTKRMAHHFMLAPKQCSVWQALRWGQVRGLGGDRQLARAFCEQQWRFIDQKHNDFWVTVIAWFVRYPEVERRHVESIVDYLHHQRFEPAYEYWGPDGREREPPPQPNLTMRGRTPPALLREVQRWKRASERAAHQRSATWERSPIDGCEIDEGSPDNGSHVRWRVRELLSRRELVAEGRKMHHCVADYAKDCARGHCSIWSLEQESCGARSRRLTIEVHRRSRQIGQVRGKANRDPTKQELRVVRAWASRAGLTMPSRS